MATLRMTEATKNCLVLVQRPGAALGSGFLAAPGHVVTCAHLVGTEIGSHVIVRWQGRELDGRVLAASGGPSTDGVWPYPDLAVVELVDGPADHPCAWWHDRTPVVGQALTAVGHAAKFRPEPEPITSTLRYHGDQDLDGGRMMRLKGDEITPGMSGGPVLDPRSGGVCAVVKATRQDDSDMGGVATPVGALRLLDPAVYRALVRAHDTYHHTHRGWPGPLAEDALESAGRCLPPQVLRRFCGLLARAPVPSPETLLATFNRVAGRHAVPLTLPLREQRDVLSELESLGSAAPDVPLALLYPVAVADDLPQDIGGQLRSDAELLVLQLGKDVGELAELLASRGSPPMLAAGEGGWSPYDWSHETEQALLRAEPSRSPILIAVDTDGEPLTDRDFSTAARHLTVTLTSQQADLIGDIACGAVESARSVESVLDAGHQVWNELTAAQPRLKDLLGRIAGAGLAQPVAWCGRRALLARLQTALLIAHTGAPGAEGFLSVQTGGHYFMPVQDTLESRRMQHRTGRTLPDVRLLDLRGAEPHQRAKVLGGAPSAEVVVVVDPDDASTTVPSLAASIRHEPVSTTRVALVFGRPLPDIDELGELLETLPCVGLAPSDLAEPALLDALRDALREHAGARSVPCIVSAVRALWIRRAIDHADLARCLSGLSWRIWSWTGLPLFAQHYGEVVPAAFPHLRDLRSIASGDWYFDRRQGIPEPYEAESLAAAEPRPEDRFHFYLSGAGGTGKSCLLRCVHDQIDARSDTVAVWYRVDAPSSLWHNVERRIREETIASVRRKLGDTSADLVAQGPSRLGAFLHAAAVSLREQDPGCEIAIFIDQLERTFESGDEPNFERLATISRELVRMLKTVQVGEGVRVFVASRKQYLPDFLGSSREAAECGLEFNVLKTITDADERVEFVRKILGWCREQELVDASVVIPADAAAYLADRVKGHPLDTTLALIQLLSANLTGRITREVLDQERPWERRFALDLQAAARDDLDWYLLLAMAHARTEIVRFEEVLWRLRMVDARLTRQVNELLREGILERLWLFGHLGRTVHARPDEADPARYLEFFHANLRDHLLRDIMGPGDTALAIHGRRGGVPPAWRALDRLAAYAHEWDQAQQLLPSDDVRVLMEHREWVIDPHTAAGESEPAFHLLFLRDPGEATRKRLCEAAMECFAFSALVHENAGGRVFEALCHDAGRRVELCEEWLARCGAGTRPAVLRYLVEIEDEAARGALVRMVLDRESTRRDELAQALADVLMEPLYSAMYRNEVVAALLGRALRQTRGDWDRLPQDLVSFVVQACGGDRDVLSSVLAYCENRIGGGGAGRAKSPLDEWLRTTVPNGDYNAGRVADQPIAAGGSVLRLAVGRNLRTVVDDARLADWSRRLRERIGLNVPALQLAVGNSLADELELASPRGRFSTGLFFADRRQVLKRQWEAEFGDAQPSGTTSCFDDASGEDVFWLPPVEVRSDYPGAVRDFDEAVVGWLEAHCRRSFALLFDTGVLIGLVRELAPSFGRPTTVGEVRRLRQVVIDLVEEGVPFGPRREVVLEELARLLPQGMQSEVVTQRIREQVQADLCRAVADESGRFTTILLDEQAEQVLVEKRIGVSGERTVLRLRPAEAQDLASAISGAVLGILQDGRRPAPVLVTLPDLRPSLSRLLRRFDHRMRVLSFTELDPEFVTESGVVVSVPMLTGDGT